MTGAMRWLIRVPASPGALLGGWLGDSSICATFVFARDGAADLGRRVSSPYW